MKREVSDRTLQRWLATGRPSRVAKLIDSDPTVAARLDHMSAFARSESDAIDELVQPSAGFEKRTETALKARLDGFAAASTFLDILALGYHAGRAILSTDADERRPDPDPQNAGPADNEDQIEGNH